MKQFYKIFFFLMFLSPALLKAQDSCRADFTSVNSNSPLSKIFTALPWHSANMPVAEICWNFGDGHDTCIAAAAGAVAPLTIIHNYAQPGNYTVCVKLKYMQGGCIAEKCKTLTVGSTTQPDTCWANYIVQSGNLSGQQYFTPLPNHNNSKPVIEVKWDFGDGTPALITPGATTVVHFYQQAGTYNVCVRIKYEGGCIAEMCKPLTITNPVDSCLANFETSPIASTPLGRKFTALPGHSNNKKPREVCWTFGDGRDTCIQYDSLYTGIYFVNHNYLQPGTYNVCVKINYFGGCIAEKCKPITVGQNTQADSCKADYFVQNGNQPGQRYFTPIPNHNNSKPVIEVKWDFGDGTPALITPGATTVVHFYPQAGTYNVCVRIKYDGGCIAEKCKPLTIANPVDSCRADFETSGIISAPLTRKFTAITWSSPVRKVQQVCWKYGDGKDTCINYDSTYTGAYFVYHTYAQYGTYNVCVKIKYYGGCIAEKCRPVTVNQPAADSCLANFEALSTAGTVLTKTFVAQPWHSQNKRPEQICWNFGDGHDTCISYNPAQVYNYFVNHTYQQQGVYNVCVKIKYQGGCVSEKCKPVTVGTITPADSCKAEFATTQYSSNIRLRKFTALPWHNNGKRPEKICWIFGDGKDTCITYNPGNPNNDYSVLHLYANNGIYTVCVKIKYQGGCEAQKCNPVAVGINTQPDSCRAAFTHTMVQNDVLWRRFNAVPWHIAQKRPYKICWTFGDGRDTCITYTNATPAVYSVLHHYATQGTYTVCVKIWYEGGCYAQKCNGIAVLNAPCRALFTDSMLSAFKVKFKGQAIIANANDPVTSWSWTFGDGTAGSGQHVIHEYAQPGTYNVCLKIRTASGCEHTFCKPKVIDSSIRILHLMPNPVQNTLYISYYSYHNETGQIKIYNIYGILVKSFSRQMTIGYNNFSTDVSTLTPGPYSLVVQTPTTLASSVFFKQ